MHKLRPLSWIVVILDLVHAVLVTLWNAHQMGLNGVTSSWTQYQMTLMVKYGRMSRDAEQMRYRLAFFTVVHVRMCFWRRAHQVKRPAKWTGVARLLSRYLISWRELIRV